MPYKRRRRRPASSPRQGAGEFLAAISSTRFVRRLIIFLLGVWLGGVVLLAVAVPRSFSSIDDLMVDPPKEASRVIQLAGPISTRAVLRHQVAQANGEVFSAWGWMQLFLSVLVLGLLVFALPFQRIQVILGGGMILLSACLKFLMLPQVQSVTARVELQQSATTMPDRDLFLAMHQSVAAFQAAIVVLALLLAWQIFKRQEPVAGPPTLKPEIGFPPPQR